MSRTVNTIIIHCSATPPGLDIGAKEIREWHVQDNGWRDIGYHFVIRRDGRIEPGRQLDLSGAHTAGHNKDSIGICLVGGVAADGKTPEGNFTPAQWAALERCVRDLSDKYPGSAVHGHNEYAAKACPCFDVPAWWAGARGK